jgi:multidrug efflux pump subunit AcrB
MKRFLGSFARNTVFANVAFVLILLAGLLASMSMLRENFPEFSLDMVSVSVPYPGADPEEVEEGISRKIEETLEAVEGIEQITTTSTENAGSARIEIKEGFDPDEVLDEIRTRIGAISTFPLDAEEPVITEMTIRDPVVLLSFSGAMEERRIKEWAERLKNELRLLPEVSQVEIFGDRDYEINIEVSEERLRQFGLSFDRVASAVRRSSLSRSGGTIRASGEEIRVRTVGRKYTGRDFASIVVLAGEDGDIITLDRVADIRDGFSDDPIQALINGRPSVLLQVFKTQEEDALAISRAVESYLRERQSQLPPRIELDVLYDNTEMLRARIDLLVKNGIIGICVVFFLLWVFLNARLSFWAGMGIPVSLAGGLIVLWALGGSINMISLFGLIMVLGIVVDDAIVVGESIYVRRRNGVPPIRAAVDGVGEVGMPVVAAVITSIVAFVPLLYVGGIMGKFIAILPVVVIACLAMSLVECLLLLPAHLSHLPEIEAPPTRCARLTSHLATLNRLTSRGLEWLVERVYRPLLYRALAWRYVTLCIAVSVLLLTLGLVRGGIIKFLTFPEIDGFVLTATAEFPNGTPPEVTAGAVRKMDRALMRLNERVPTRSGDPLVEQRLALVGQTLGEIPSSGPNYGAVQAILLESDRRGVHTQDLMVQWEEEIGPVPGIKSLTFEGLQAGPPGAPIEVWIQGADMDRILAAAEELMQRLAEFEGVYQVRSDFSPGKDEVRLKLKPEARTLGITVDDLAGQVSAAFFGREAVRLQRGRDDVRVKVRYTSEERSRLTTLRDLRIRTGSGREIPLFSVAEASFEPGYSAITRTNGLRRVAVSAGVDTKRANANEIFNELSASFFPDLKDRYPRLHVSLQGEKKKMRESLGSLYVGFPLAVIGIFIIIATIFRSYVQPFVILFTVPFGIIGAVLGHALMGFDLTLMSAFGMVALTGVVVNDAIVLIERVNENLAAGESFFDALVGAGTRRFRPIVLTPCPPWAASPRSSWKRTCRPDSSSPWPCPSPPGWSSPRS